MSDVGSGDGAEVTEEEGHVHLGGTQKFEQVVHERLVRFLQRAEAQLLGPCFALLVHGEFHVVVQDRLKPAHVVHQRRHGFEQTSHVPRTDVLLLTVAVAAATGVGRVGRPVHIVRLQPAVGAVVNGQPVDGHVVGVHDAVYEADSHPMSDHDGGSFSHFGQPGDEPFVRARIMMGKMMAHGVVNKGAQRLMMAVRNVDLEATEADETGRHTAHDRSRFRSRIAVVENVPHDRFAG